MYARALQHAGAEVRLVSLVKRSRHDDAGGGPVSGIYGGVPYEYAAGTRARPGSFIARRLLTVRVALRTWSLIRSSSSVAPASCVVLIYTESSFWMALLTLLAHTSRAAAVLDLCEYPMVGRLHNARGFLERWLRRNVLYPALDGIVPISSFLDEYVGSTSRPPATLLVPVMVDTDHFSPPAAGTQPLVQRVVYCGALGRLEEVERAVRSFARAAHGLPEAELVIVGDGPADRVERAKSLVRDLGLQTRTRFTGDIGREQLPEVLRSAAVFVLPRAAGTFSKAGLPNKLGEYLSIGRAVVVTANGDIPRYVQDGVSAFLVDPEDQDGFAERLRHALEDPEDAAAVGVRGRDVAVRELDYRRHGARLVEFFSSLASRRAR
jgi:glycosyltransferase involved in cell wall biosynthesis